MPKKVCIEQYIKFSNRNRILSLLFYQKLKFQVCTSLSWLLNIPCSEKDHYQNYGLLKTKTKNKTHPNSIKAIYIRHKPVMIFLKQLSQIMTVFYDLNRYYICIINWWKCPTEYFDNGDHQNSQILIPNATAFRVSFIGPLKFLQSAQDPHFLSQRTLLCVLQHMSQVCRNAEKRTCFMTGREMKSTS